MTKLDFTSNDLHLTALQKETFLKYYKKGLYGTYRPWFYYKSVYDYMKSLDVSKPIPFVEFNEDLAWNDYRIFDVLINDNKEISEIEIELLLNFKKQIYHQRLKYSKISMIIPVKPINNKSSKLICDIIKTVETALGPMTELGVPREYYKRVIPTKEHCELLIDCINSKLTYESPISMFSFRKEVFRVLKNIYKMNETDETKGGEL